MPPKLLCVRKGIDAVIDNTLIKVAEDIFSGGAGFIIVFCLHTFGHFHNKILKKKYHA